MNETVIEIAPDHPAFAGHFPGHPILPGALLLAQAMQALDRAGVSTRGCAISSAKFHSPLAPGESLRVRWEAVAGGSLRLDLSAGGRRVASAMLILHAEPQAARR